MVKKEEKTIDANKFYTLYEIVKDGLVPGVLTYSAVKSIIVNDKLFNGPLQAKPVVRGTRGMQYKVKGSNIIKYLVIRNEQKKSNNS